MMKLIRKILCWIFLFLLVCIFFASGFYIFVTKDTKLDPKKLIFQENTVCVFDNNGLEIKSVADFSLHQTTAIDSIPQKTRMAFVDIEDKRFFSHNGFDIRRILKAAYNNLKAKSFKQGASTISQQLIKNTHLTQEKTLKRKLKEFKLTKQLEKAYSKNEILEKYLNTIYFGHSCFGICSAADFYFGKTPSELSLADSAILAGLVKSPNNYSPFKNPENCKKRKRSVLEAMYKNGTITQEEKENAIKEELPSISVTKNRNNDYLHFVFDELSFLSERHNFPVGGNIKIFTYMDPVAQTETEKILENVTDTDKSAFILDCQNNGFKACVSSIGNIQRLPGSLLKPLLVYAPALEENLLSPATPIADEEVNYGGYCPENFDGKYHGYISARECVEKSLNIPAVKILSSLGVNKGVEYLKKLRLPVEQDDVSLALALGGMKNGYSLQELVAAYSVFPNQGELYDCGFISKIEVNGQTVYEKKRNKTTVFSSESAYLMTDMLKSTAKEGTAKKLRNLTFDIAAKTGTVGTKSGNTDAYALSFTSKDCIGIWLGNKDNRFIDYTGGGLPCNLLLKINEALYQIYQQRKISIPNFSKPSTVVRVALDKNTYYDTHIMSLADPLAPIEYRITELFKKDYLPLQSNDSFSNPRIISPAVDFSNGKVIIAFDKNSPSYYQYKIDRYDYVTRDTLYYGDYIESFIDSNITQNKNYIYTITPFYNGKAGESITLPTISTKNGESFNQNDSQIIQKDWWAY